jgi:hypothetical protein
MLRRHTLILPVTLTFEDLPAAAALIESARRGAADAAAS